MHTYTKLLSRMTTRSIVDMLFKSDKQRTNAHVWHLQQYIKVYSRCLLVCALSQVNIYLRKVSHDEPSNVKQPTSNGQQHKGDGNLIRQEIVS